MRVPVVIEVASVIAKLLCKKRSRSASNWRAKVKNHLHHTFSVDRCQGRAESTSVAAAKIRQFKGRWESWFGFWQGEREGISLSLLHGVSEASSRGRSSLIRLLSAVDRHLRSEEHTSELQSLRHL